MSPTPCTIGGTALPGPTRLAVGLEQEVFYAKCLVMSALRFAPVFRIGETVVPPCHLSFDK